MAATEQKTGLAALEQMLNANRKRLPRRINLNPLILPAVIAVMLVVGSAWNLSRPISETDARIIQSLISTAAAHRGESSDRIRDQVRAALALAPGQPISKWNYSQAVQILLADDIL